MPNISVIEGIGPRYAEKLATAGIKTVEDMLKSGATKAGRAAIAAKTGIEDMRILNWVNMADLLRVKGLNAECSQLLHEAGVDTIKELRNRKAENLHIRIEEVNYEKNLGCDTPSLEKVARWIEHAKKLEPIVTY